MPRPKANNPIGESIYNRIKEYDLHSKKVFLQSISTEHKNLYDRYRIYMNGLNRSTEQKEVNKEKAKEGMRILRQSRTKEEIKEQRKPYDKKYNEKRKLTREQASVRIQKQFCKKKEANDIVKSILDDIIDKAPNMKIVNGELKQKRGRKIK